MLKASRDEIRLSNRLLKTIGLKARKSRDLIESCFYLSTYAVLSALKGVLSDFGDSLNLSRVVCCLMSFDKNDLRKALEANPHDVFKLLYALTTTIVLQVRYLKKIDRNVFEILRLMEMASLQGGDLQAFLTTYFIEIIAKKADKELKLAKNNSERFFM